MPGSTRLLPVYIIAAYHAIGALSMEVGELHPKRDYLTVEEKEAGWQLGPDQWARPPKSKWEVANKRLADKRSLHCPVCLQLAVRLYQVASRISDSTGNAKVTTSWRMKNGQRDFQRTEAMKSDTVIGEAMEELCDSRHLPKQIPTRPNSHLSR